MIDSLDCVSANNFARRGGELANFVYVNKYTGTNPYNVIAQPIGVESIERPDGKDVYILNHGSITAGNSASLELENTNTDYQTTGTAEVILILTGATSPLLTDFEIIEDDTVNAGTGTQKEGFPSMNLQSNRLSPPKNCQSLQASILQ